MPKTTNLTSPVFNKLIGFTKPLPNRLVIVTGDKGGVGSWARGLLHSYLSENENPIVFEAENRQTLKDFTAIPV